MPTSFPTAQELYRDHRFLDPLPIPHRIDLTQGPHPRRRIEMKPALLKLHSKLPATHLWTYEGSYPGPVIEVHKGSRVAIEWVNHLTGTVPVETMSSAQGDPNDPSQNHAGGIARDGSDGVPADPLFEKVKHLPAWTVVHLHGGRTEPDSDGWTENVIPYGHSKVSHYDTHLPQHQHAPTLWFHDHAMGVTRLNVCAGLAGLWLIRDAADQAVLDALHQAHAPHQPHNGQAPLEIPLVLADRNLQTEDSSPDSSLKGDLLLKTDDGPEHDSAPNTWKDRGPMEFFGPFTLVNGAIWPHCTLKPRPYRLRVVNGSNARTYQLVLVQVMQDSNGQEQLEPVSDPQVLRQIGSDGGLFAQPVELPLLDSETGGPYLSLTLAPAERADLILDLSSLTEGTKLRWINTAVAPFDGNSTFALHDDPAAAPLPDGSQPQYSVALGQPDLKARVPFPDVMEFRVHGSPGAPLQLPSPLSDYQAALTHDQLGDHSHRLIVLAEQEDPADMPPPGVSDLDWKRTTVLSLREMELAGFIGDIPSGHESDGIPLLSGSRQVGEIDIDFFVRAHGNDPDEVKHHRCRYRTMAAMFHDTINFRVRFGSKEVWNLLNLSGDVHPIHLHLVQFQHFGRDGTYTMQADPYPPDDAPGPLVTYAQAQDPAPRTDSNELGWKDTIRANPGELLKILATFDGFCGRYMYHCHILEHEDHEMMRPYVVLPPEILDLMPGMSHMPGMHGSQ